jgi:hypothetical protein
MDTKLSRMIELARGHTRPDVLFSYPVEPPPSINFEWPAIEVGMIDPLRRGVVQ